MLTSRLCDNAKYSSYHIMPFLHKDFVYKYRYLKSIMVNEILMMYERVVVMYQPMFSRLICSA